LKAGAWRQTTALRRPGGSAPRPRPQLPLAAWSRSPTSPEAP